MLSDSDSSGDENDTSLKLKINQKFAKRYEDQKRFQDLQRNQELLGDLGESGSESESSSEDEDAVGLSTALDVEIMNTISSIKKKDPKIYEKNTKFYTQNAEDSDSSDDESSDEEGGKKKKKSKKNKKKTYKDVVREQLLSGKGDSDEDNQADGTYYDKEKALAYDQEQEKIRQKFLSSAMDSDDSDGEGDDMLTVKPKSAKEQAEEEERLKSAIAEVVSLTKKDTNLDPTEEDFLATYMLQKKWMDDADLKVDKKTDNFMTKEDEDELLDLEEDEEELYEVDKFESKYNFRFEEEQGEGGGNVIGGNNMGEVVGHARNVEGSLRRVDDKRKKKREERKERKEKEKRVKEAELRRLKNLKREELKARLKQIEEVCGVKGLVKEDDLEDNNSVTDGVTSKKKGGIDIMDLDDDWDPEKHEALMKSQFNDDYYDQDDPDFAPGGKFYDPTAEDDAGEGYSTVGGWNEDYDEDDEEYHGGKGENGGRYEDQEEEELGNAEMDAELYKLDYEDIVAGIPCRFKYTTVEPEDYGLTIDDILDAQDNELNKFVGLKKISASYREARKAEGQELKLSRKRKHLREAIKQRKAEAEDQNAKALAEKNTSDELSNTLEEGDDHANKTEKKAKRKRNKKKVIGGDILSTVSEADVPAADNSTPALDKKQKKRKKRQPAEVSDKDAAKKRRMELYG